MTSPSTGSETAGHRKRVEFIDLLRGWAVVVMIETHVVNATLSSEMVGTMTFQYLKFINGLVAPSFLFASGLAYAITTRRRVNDYLAFGPPLFRQFGRILLIFCIGYALHVPIFSYTRLVAEATAEQWQSFFQVDVLQCIAMILLFLQLLLLLFRSERALYRAALMAAIAVVVLTPLVWNVDFLRVLPWPLAAYMNGERFSLFPLFPWSAFLFAGALTGHYYSRAKEKLVRPGTGNEIGMMRSLAWGGGSAILLGIALEPLAEQVYPAYDYWSVSPSFFLLRLGLVMLFCSGLFFFEQRKSVVSPHSTVTLFGRESLFVYVVHLLLIYGNFGGFNFREAVHHSYGYGEAAIATVVLTALMYVFARAWSSIKATSPRLKVALNISTLVFVIALFFFGKGE